ncbi:saccharopepsin [Clonorchis sinensis]|uniref:Saccharopepsin n=1 Tax=Clonorchis sinensis TaxID=79923 RepID=A0A419PX54_CLOSI|nr:saccharopepsin [Clonorchis sinensis]
MRIRWFVVLGVFGFALAEWMTKRLVIFRIPNALYRNPDDTNVYVTSVVTIPLRRQSVARYHCSVRIEKDVFDMLLDTGSSSVWVASNFVDEGKWGNKNLLDTSRAISLRISRDHFYQAYASNDVNGLKATADMQFGQMLVKSVPFSLVTHGSKQISEDSFDGIIGLSRGPLHSLNTRNVFYFIYQKDPARKKFGFYFKNEGGCFLMGEDVETFLPPDVNYIDVRGTSYWETAVDWIFIQNIGFNTKQYVAILDTGSQSTFLPKEL